MKRINPIVKEAATVILVRQGPESLEVFMLERPSRGDFPELHVFPGGKVDPEDKRLAQNYDSSYERTSWGLGAPTPFAITAIRECFEEAGVLFVTTKANAQWSATAIEQYRQELLNSEYSFAEFLQKRDLRLDFSKVHYFSHWITPEHAPARFNVRFFLATLPYQQEASHHISETSSGSWISPRTALRNVAKKKWQMIVPTLTSLRMIAGYNQVSLLLSDVVQGKHRIPVTPAMHTQGMQHFELS